MTALDELLADTRHVDAVGHDALTRARTVLDAAITTARNDRRTSRLAARGSARRKLTITGLVTAGVTLLIAIPTVVIGTFHPGVDAEAAAVLRTAGRAAAGQSGGWPDARYWHVASSYVRNGHTYRRDIWVAHHGESVLHDRGLGPGIDPGVISLGESSHFDAACVQLTWDQLYSLPTDPDELAKALRADGANDDTTMFNAVGDLLRETPAPPALRKALYDVAATIPGIHVRGDVTDAQGRPGTGIEHDGETVVIDTATGQLLEDIEDSWVGTYISQGPANKAPKVGSK